MNDTKRTRANARAARWRERNRDQHIAAVKRWQAVNKDKINARRRLYRKEREQRDPLAKLRRVLGNRLRKLLRAINRRKDSPTLKVVGCSAEFLRAYIEARMKPGMTWDNYGTVWEIDHATPFASGKTKREIERLSHYTNLQPLWSDVNRAKADSVPIQAALNFYEQATAAKQL